MLKNYTSSVSAANSIQFIESCLIRHKATQILKTYTPEGKVGAISFIIVLNGVEIPIRIGAKVAECQKVLVAHVRKPRPGTLDRVADQAERTAWKIEADWVAAQMAKIELAQTELMEVFLPYVIDKRTDLTLFETMKETGFKALLPAAASQVGQPARADRTRIINNQS
jgi:hypothetical protein